MDMLEDGGWKFEVLGSDNGRVVRLIVEMRRGGEKEIEREVTRILDLQEQDFSSMIM